MKLTRWSPARDLLRVQDELNRMVDRFFTPDLFEGSDMNVTAWVPNMDVAENKDQFTVSVELPGLKHDDVHVTLREGVLTIEGERKEEREQKDVQYHRYERRYGKFMRSFQLPTRVEDDKVSANFKDGILTIEIPKAEEVKPKEIKVKVS